MEPDSEDIVEEALSLIQNEAGLPHPSGPLLESFVSEALSPRLAAAHVLQACRSGDDQRAELLALVSDWTSIVESMFGYGSSPPALNNEIRAKVTRRDGAKCCITGKPASFMDPLVVLPLLPVPSRWLDVEPRISEMLGVFFGPPYRDWWLAYARQPERMSPYHSHWLVRKSAAEAFAKGTLKLDRLRPSMIEYRIRPCLIGTFEKMIHLDGPYPLLGDHSRSGIPKVDARFVGTHARLAPSIRWLEVSTQIARDERISSSPPTTNDSRYVRAGSFGLPQFLQTTCLKAWLMVPSKARLATYKLLKTIGQRLYGDSDSFSIQRLPFGLYLKSLGAAGALRNEVNALNMVRQLTSIPVARPLDQIPVSVTEPDSLDAEDAYLLTSRLPGVPLAHAIDMLSDRDAREFVTSMQDFLSQLRAIPKAVCPEYNICNTLGEACRDPRIRDANPVGPFKDEVAFSELLRYSDDPARRGHANVFTHADLSLRNILVDRFTRPDGTRGWEVTGIVDWENSGFFPEYWDCTKALFEGWRYDQRWRTLIYETFKSFGDYSQELEVEKRSWREGDGA